MNCIKYLSLPFAVLLMFCACNKQPEIVCSEACSTDSLQHQQKILLIGIDGCRSDALTRANTPAIDGLMQQGKYSLNVNRGAMYTVSGPGWSSMLTGVWPDKHGVVDNSYQADNYAAYPPFLCRVKTASPCYKVASIVHYKDLNDQIIEPCAADILLDYTKDILVAEAATNYVRDCDIDVLFVHLDDVDYAGHTSGFHPDVPAYIHAIESTDALLQAVYSREINHNEDWLVIISTDHGGKIDGSHEDHPYDPEVTRVFSVFRNNNTNDKGLIPYDPPIIDIAPTILQHLGIPIDSSWNIDGQAVAL